MASLAGGVTAVVPGYRIRAGVSLVLLLVLSGCGGSSSSEITIDLLVDANAHAGTFTTEGDDICTDGTWANVNPVPDDDLGVVTDSVVIDQTLTLCMNYASGTVTGAGPGGSCGGGSVALTMPGLASVALCVNPYS